MFLQLIQGLLIVSVTLPAAWLTGKWVLKPLPRFQHTALQAAAEMGSGLLIFSYVIFLATLTGTAREVPSYLVFLFLSVTLAAAWKGRKALLEVLQGLRENWILPALGLPLLLVIVVATTLPPTAIDELVYHLEIPRQHLSTGGQLQFEDNFFAYFPALGEMLFLLGMSGAGEAGARLFHTVYALLLALAVYGFARSRLDLNSSLLAVAAVISVPSVMVLAPIAYVDLMFTFYAFVSAAALLQTFQDRKHGWAVLAGILAAGAWATKYTGLQWVLLLVLLVLLEHLAARRQTVPWTTILVPAVALLGVVPYLIRNWIFTGWPLFPFRLGSLPLEPSINWDPERADLLLRWVGGFGSASVWERLAAPVLVFIQGRFEDLSAYDGVVGPVFLLVPILLWRIQLEKEHKILGLLVLLFLGYWALTTAQVRFLLPVIPLLAFLLALGLNRLKKQWLTALAILLIGWNLVTGLVQLQKHDPGRYLVEQESRSEYLSRLVVGYPLYREACDIAGPRARLYLINMRNFGYFLDCPWRADFIFEYYRIGQLLDEGGTADDLRRFFSGQGVTHLMIDEAVTFNPQALTSSQQAVLRRFLSEGAQLAAENAQRPGQKIYLLR